MTLVTGTVQDLGYDGMEGTLWARPARFRSDGQVVYAPERKPYKVVDGVVSADLAPGPAVLELQVGSHARGTFEVVIPEEDTTLADLLDTVFAWEPAQVSLFVAEREAAEQAKDDAVQAATLAGTAKTGAETAAQQTGQDRTAVAADKDTVVAHVQALAEPNDAAVLGLISEGADTQTKAALNATYGRATQAARRGEFSNLASMIGGGGQWYFKRQTGAEHHFIRDIGDGQYLSWITHRPWHNEGPDGMGSTAHYIKNGTVGVPMKMLDWTAAEYTGNWSAPTAMAGVPDDPPMDYGLWAEEVPVTVTESAGGPIRRLYFDTPDPKNPTRYYFRKVVLPGLGPDGADLVTRVVAAPANGEYVTIEGFPDIPGSVTAKFYPARAVSGMTSQGAQVATWTSPPGATGVGVIVSTLLNQSLASVTIDGDPTAATALPTAGELVEQERYPASILTTNGGPVDPTHRVLNTYGGAKLNQYQALAVELDPGEHTVVLTAMDVSPINGNSTRMGIAGFGYCDESTRITDSLTAVFPTRWVTITQASCDMAYQHRPAGASSSVFAGTSHGYEQQLGPLDIVIDGEKVEMQDDETRPFSTIAVTRRSHLFHPEKLDEPSFEMRLTYRAGQSVGLDVEHTETWLTDGWSKASYPIMMTLQGDNFPWFQGDANGVAELVDQKDEEYRVIGPHSAYIAWHEDDEVIAGVIFPAAEQITDGFTLFGGSAVRDRTGYGVEKITKVYIGRRGDISLGDVWSSRATYFIGRLPDGPGRYLPVE